MKAIRTYTTLLSLTLIASFFAFSTVKAQVCNLLLSGDQDFYVKLVQSEDECEIESGIYMVNGEDGIQKICELDDKKSREDFNANQYTQNLRRFYTMMADIDAESFTLISSESGPRPDCGWEAIYHFSLRDQYRHLNTSEEIFLVSQD